MCVIVSFINEMRIQCLQLFERERIMENIGFKWKRIAIVVLALLLVSSLAMLAKFERYSASAQAGSASRA